MLSSRLNQAETFPTFADDMMSFGEEVVEEPVALEPVDTFQIDVKLKIL